MRVISFLFGKFLRKSRIKAATGYKTEHRCLLNGAFYVEHVSENGDVMFQYVEAKRLTRRGCSLYLYGWCEMLPAFRCVPVDRITQLVDDRTGEMVPRGDVAGWLTRRTLN